MLDENFFVTAKTLLSVIEYSYNEQGMLSRKTFKIGEDEVTYLTEYPENGEPVVKIVANGKTVKSHSKTDTFGRKVFEELQLGTGFVSREFSYHEGEASNRHKENDKLVSTPTTNLVKQITLSDGRTISYEYDCEERITKVIDSIEGVTEYEYDALGQLVKETKDNVVINQMTYDSYGNILTKNGNVYEYDTVWKDKLIKYNGRSINYDGQGNPVDYTYNVLSWGKGRQLEQYNGCEFYYNANGVRKYRKINGVMHTFDLEGTKILKESWQNNTLIPVYDNSDSVCGINYNGTPYYFLKNLQGDIIAITNQNGDTVVRYSYDAWGKCTITQDTSGCSLSYRNPFRYRGYFYDQETGLYYLNSRYYDPETGRFLNADDPEFVSTTGGNLFAYCHNCPTNRVDYYGFCDTPVDTLVKFTGKYSGFVGFGVQIILYANLLCFQGFMGAEALWFTSTNNNNFGNGIIPWCYYFIWGSMGITLDFGKILSPEFIKNPKNILDGLGLSFSINLSITFFLIYANKMKDPKSYLGKFNFYTNTILGVTTSKAWSSTITTYGIGFSFDVSAGLKGISVGALLFGGTSGASYYYSLPLNPNAKELYSLVESQV